MFKLSYLTLNVHIGDAFWKYAFLTSGVVVGGYVGYKLMTARKRRRVVDVQKKCVFITGCDSGFGRALAVQLDGIGCPVFAGCLTNQGAKELSKVTSERLHTLQLDVTSSESIKQAFQFVTQNMNDGCDFWGLVNNAGISGCGGPAEFVPKSEYEQIMQVNFLGMVDVILNFLPMIKKHRGRVVNIASAEAKIASPNVTAYVASKYAVLGYSEALRREKNMWGIKVSTIVPGFFATSMTNIENIITKKQKQWDTLPLHIKEEYGDEYFNTTVKALEVYTKYAQSDLSPVTDAIEHALFSVKPQNMYKVGFDAKLYTFVETLPFGLTDWFMNYDKSLPTPKILMST